MIKSQQMNKEIYPSDFTEEDKVNFDLLVADAKRIFPTFEEWMIKLAVIAHINHMKGLGIPSTQEEIEAIKNQYDLSDNKVYVSPYDPDFKIEQTLKEVIKVGE